MFANDAKSKSEREDNSWRGRISEVGGPVDKAGWTKLLQWLQRASVANKFLEGLINGSIHRFRQRLRNDVC